ncbi:ABC transporter permease [Roseivirga sp. E12]|uniref:ABC transporter permease n=1 Tax=Roseivirga sp. E12 TaxID=2819237 RepID=UPI001ABBE702|nr:ABC transporter permease [Roseivirga sp. E12]MBO3697151.1 ABC transporter permease [Roseivirga sp. E12]
MIKNYFSIVLRSLKKKKVFAFINICGLAIGICAFLLILDFISFENSFDNFHQKGDRIYRVQYEKISADRHDKSAGLAAGGGPALMEAYPEVETFSKIWGTNHMVNLIKVNDEPFESEKLFYADSSFFELFDFDFLAGNRMTVLDEVNSIVITESAAERFFGRKDVLNEAVYLQNGMTNVVVKVTGILKDLPANTHFDFEVLVSFESLVNATETAANSFGWNAFPTYLLLKEGVDPSILEAKFPDFIETHYQNAIGQGIQPLYKLRSLEDIYLHSNVRFEVGPTGSYQVLQILTGISVFIIILAYFNYINITTAQALDRAKEVGVRKAAGANKAQLFTQFMVESFFFNFLSMAAGFTLMQVSKPLFTEVIGKEFPIGLTFSTAQFLALIIILVMGTLFSGLYPAWILSKLKTSEVLRGKTNVRGRSGFLRKSLVVVQFSILCFLLVGSLAVREQIQYMLNADLGFDPNQVLVIKGPAAGGNTNLDTKLQSFMARLESTPQVIEASHSTVVPGKEISWINNDVRREGASESESASIHFIGVSDNYLNTLDLKLLAGRNFDKEILSDTGSILLSNSALKALGFTSPEQAIDQKVMTFGERRVIGVVDDYMQESFKKGYNATAYLLAPWANNYFSLKISAGNAQGVTESLEKIYREHFAGNPFEYFFLDEFFQRQFEEDRTFAKTFNLFTLLGIWISCLGLIGLTLHAVSLRRKEIGIRKVLGAKLLNVVVLVSGKLIYPIVIAVVLSIPVTYYLVNQWLQNYTFATNLGPTVFILPVLAIVLLTLITTSILSIRTGLKNPVDSLRYE